MHLVRWRFEGLTGDVGRLAEISHYPIKVGSMGGSESSSAISAAQIRVYYLGDANRRLAKIAILALACSWLSGNYTCSTVALEVEQRTFDAKVYLEAGASASKNGNTWRYLILRPLAGVA